MNVANLTDDSDTWRKFWNIICKQGTGEQYRQELIDRYSEKHRAYHTVQHLTECLDLFKHQQHLAQHPAEVFFAIWYHDAIYNPTLPNNEAASANLAIAHLSTNDVDLIQIDRISNLVLATKHSIMPTNLDQALLVDIDLAILGANKSRFAQYEQQIRQEYSFVPEFVFKQKRAEILKDFLLRPKIYNTERRRLR